MILFYFLWFQKRKYKWVGDEKPWILLIATVNWWSLALIQRQQESPVQDAV